jgi:hypothetical protein
MSAERQLSSLKKKPKVISPMTQDTPTQIDALVSMNTEPGLSCDVNGGLHSEQSELRPKNKLTADYSDVAKPKS